MATNRKVIITCASTGSIHTPTMSEYLPLTPEQIAEQSIAAAEAGAAILHLHARDPEDGRPTPDPDVGLFPMLARYDEFRYEWERAHLENSRDFIFRNTFKDIEYILEVLGEGCGTRFEFECYDIGHLYNLAHFLDRGLVKPPLFVQSIFGILGGIGADPENVTHMRRIADKLFGDQYIWSILAGGRHQLPLVTMGAVMGSNVRVGLEDSLYAGKGRLATSNAEQVSIIRRILERLSLDIASPDEAREMLGLKGADKVAI